MEYKELKELIEKIKTMRLADTDFLAYRWVKLSYENYTIIDVVNASELIEDMFLRLVDFEDDVERAEYLFKEYLFKERTKFIEEHIENVVGDYLYEYGSKLEPDEFYDTMITEKEYKDYTPAEIKNMWEQLKTSEIVKFTDDGYAHPYDSEDDDEEILDWWIEICQNAMREEISSYETLSKIEIREQELEWKEENLIKGEYICSECLKVIKCLPTEHNKEYKILCEDCMKHTAIIESIKTELFF